MRKKISIVVPVYNGAATISELINRLLKTLKDESLEIILVNDGSVDNSDEVCREEANKHPGKIQYVHLSKNFGEHNAVMAGLNSSSGDFIVIMDDDLQNPPEEVPKLINEIIKNNYDIVYSYYGKKKHSIFRNLGSIFTNWMANFMIKKPKDLYLSSFKCMNRFIVNEIIKYTGPYPYIDGLALRVTRNIGKVLVEHNERKKGKSGYTFKKAVSLWLNMFLNFSIRPLRFSSLLGLLLSTFGFLMAIIVIIEKMRNPLVPVGWSFMIIAIISFSGVQLLMLGLIGEYLGHLFLSYNETPQFIVREKYSGASEDCASVELQDT